MLRSRRFLFALLLCVPAAFAAGEGTARPVTVVSLAPALTELIWHLGAGECQVGRSDACDWPPEAAQVPVAGKFARPVLEQVLRMKPDCVVANDLVNPGIGRVLRQNGIRTEVHQCRNFDDYLAWVDRLGQILHREEAAEREKQRIREFLERCEKRPPLRGKALWIVWDSPLLVAGGGSLPDVVMKHVGIANIAADAGQEYFKCSYDWVLRHQPDVIIWTPPGKPDPNHRFWGALKAVKTGKIALELNSSLIQRPGPRLPEGIELLRAKLERLEAQK